MMESTAAQPATLRPFVGGEESARPFWRRLFHPLPRSYWLLALALAGISLLSANPLVTALSILTVPVLVSLLWSEGEPPILLFACAIQWLQVTTVLHYANFAGADLVFAFGGEELQMAVGLGLFGLIALALGARVGSGRRDPEISHRAEAEALRCSVPVAFLF